MKENESSGGRSAFVGVVVLSGALGSSARISQSTPRDAQRHASLFAVETSETLDEFEAMTMNPGSECIDIVSKLARKSFRCKWPTFSGSSPEPGLVFIFIAVH